MSFPAPEPKPDTSGKKLVEVDHFKDSGMARKAMLALKAPILDEARDGFLTKVSKSPVARQIAFTLLSEGWKAKPPTAWTVLRPKLKDILAEGRQFPSSDVITRTETRKKWLSTEFGITGKIQDSARFNASFGYLWPLFVILSFPDNESWLGQALGEFITELEASIEVGNGKSGAPKKGHGITSLSRAIALDIVPLVQANALSVKHLKTHLRLISKASGLSQTIASAHEISSRQSQVLDRLLSEEKEKVAAAEDRLTSSENALAHANSEIANLKQKLAAADEQKDMQQGIAEMRLKDALVQQRAELRFKLRQGLGNIKLYTDRDEPAKDRVLKICDDLIAHLDGTTS